MRYNSFDVGVIDESGSKPINSMTEEEMRAEFIRVVEALTPKQRKQLLAMMKAQAES